jgi:hypothetical protein
MGVHCHLCGATLRGPAQFRQLLRPDGKDAIYVCRDEDRCSARVAFDPVSGRSAPSGSVRLERARELGG